ncbi:hypothetical protein ACFL0R_04460 [Pseudomonadota bacterium]
MRPLLITLALTLFCQPLWADDPKTAAVNNLVDQVIQTYGGQEIWNNTQGILQSGTIHSQRRGTSGQIVRGYQHPHRMRIDIRYSASDTELRQLDGELAWKDAKPASQPYMLATRLQAARLGAPQLLLENRADVKDLGMIQSGTNKGLHRIEIPLELGLKLILEIDPQSGHILHSRGLMTMGGQALEFSASYEDFRMIEGHLVAFREHHYAMGGYIGYTQLDKVKFVSTFPNHSFHP